jgi:MraZ protein
MRRVPIDAKGRITIPGRYRSTYEDELRGDWVVYLVADRHRIDVLPREKYEEKYRRIIKDDSSHPDRVNERRRFMVGTEIKGLDPEGRLTLSKEMQNMIKIGSHAVLVWMRGWLEIWPEVEFDAWLSSAPSIDDFERKAGEPPVLRQSSVEQTAADGRGESVDDSSAQ